MWVGGPQQRVCVLQLADVCRHARERLLSPAHVSLHVDAAAVQRESVCVCVIELGDI